MSEISEESRMKETFNFEEYAGYVIMGLVVLILVLSIFIGKFK